MSNVRIPISALAPALGLAVLTLLLPGCSGGDPTTAGLPKQDATAVQSGQKVVAPAGENTAAQALGGSGMPAEGASGPGTAPVLIDAPANDAATTAGGSGMPAIK